MTQTLDQALVAFNQTGDVNKMHNCANAISRLITQENMRTIASFFIRTLVTGERSRVQVACCALVYFSKQHETFTAQFIEQEALEILRPVANLHAKLQRSIAALGVCHILEALEFSSVDFAIAFSSQFSLNLECELVLYQAYYQYSYKPESAASIFETPPMQNIGKKFEANEAQQYASYLMEAASTEKHPFLDRFEKDYREYPVEFLKSVLEAASRDRSFTFLTAEFTAILKDPELAEKNKELLQYILPFDYLRTTVVEVLAKAIKDDIKYLTNLIHTVQESDCNDYKDRLIRFVATQEQILGHHIIDHFIGFVTKENVDDVIVLVCEETHNMHSMEMMSNIVGFLASIVRNHPKQAILLFMTMFDNLIYKLNDKELTLYPLELSHIAEDAHWRDIMFRKVYESIASEKETISVLARCLIGNYVEGSLKECDSECIETHYPYLELSYQFLCDAKVMDNADYNEVVHISRTVFDYLVVLSLFEDNSWTIILKKFNQLVLALDSQNVDQLDDSQKDHFFDTIGACVVQFIMSFVSIDSKTISQFNTFVFKLFLPIFDAHLIEELLHYLSVDSLVESMEDGDEAIEERFEHEEEEVNEPEEWNTFLNEPQNTNEYDDDDEYDKMLASILLSRREREQESKNIYHEMHKALDLLKTFIEEQPDSPAILLVLEGVFRFLQYPRGMNVKLQHYDSVSLNATTQKARSIFESACREKRIRELVPIEDELGAEFGLQPFIDELVALVGGKLPMYDLALLYIKLVAFSLAGILESSPVYNNARDVLLFLFKRCCEFLTQNRVVLYKDFFVDFFSVRFEAFHEQFRVIFAAELKQFDALKPGLLGIGIVHELFLVRSKEIPPALKLELTRSLISYGLTELQRHFERLSTSDEEVTFGLMERFSDDICKFILSFAKRQPIKLPDLSVAVLAAVEAIKSNGVQVGQQERILQVWANISRLLE